MEEVRMTFTEHLEELRNRIIKSVIVLVLAFLLCFFFLGKHIVTFVAAPLVQALETRRHMAEKMEASLSYDSLLAMVRAEGLLSEEQQRDLRSLVTKARLNRIPLPEFASQVQADQSLASELREAVPAAVARLQARSHTIEELLAAVGSEHSLSINAQELLRKLVAATKPPPFLITSPPEGFIAFAKVCLVAALFITSPYLIYQIWGFVGAGLYPHERRYVAMFGPISAVLFLAGSSFFYFLVAKYGLFFLFRIGPWQLIDPRMKINDYVSFFLLMSLTMGAVFELPLVMVFLAKAGIVEPNEMARQRRLAYLIVFVVAAILTPPDVVSQLFLAGPLLVLFELGLLAARRAHSP